MRLHELVRFLLRAGFISLVIASCGDGEERKDAGLPGNGGMADGGSKGGGTGSGGIAASGGRPGSGGVTSTRVASGLGGASGTGGGTSTTVGHYVVSADGNTVTDTTTGLVWQRDPSHSRPGCGYSPLCNLAEAKQYCASLDLDGQSWRLPTKDELSSIVEKDATSVPTIDRTAFPYTPLEGFWTSTPAADSSGFFYFVQFTPDSNGSASPIVFFRVRCVR
jgi:hypothetical protein